MDIETKSTEIVAEISSALKLNLKEIKKCLDIVQKHLDIIAMEYAARERMKRQEED